MGATSLRSRLVLSHSILGLPLLILTAAACTLAGAVILTMPASANAAPAVHVDLTRNMQTVNGYGFTSGSTVTIDVFAAPPPGGSQVWHHVAGTPGGAFSIGPEVHGQTFAPGMHVRVRDDATSTVKDLTLAPLTFNALRWDDDTARGTAGPGATVQVYISSPGLPTQDQVTATADSNGAWIADFHAVHGTPPGHTFDVLYGMFANAHVQDGDQDATTLGSPPPPDVTGELEGRIWGGNWAHGSSVSVQVRQGTEVLYADSSVPTDQNGFFAIEREDIGFGFDAGMRITVSDANYTKDLTLADLTFVPLDAANDTASGTAPAGASVEVRVWNGEGSEDLIVTANGSGAWVADFGAAGFDITWSTDGEARYWEESGAGGDGDSTMVHPLARPWIYAGQRAGICGGGFAADATVDIEVTDAGGATVYSGNDVPTDANGAFDVQEWTLEFQMEPGMQVEVTDGTWTKELTLVPLTIDLVDPATNTASGTGPAGEVVSVDVNSDSGGASKEVTVLSNGTWTADFWPPFDVTSAMNGGVAHFDEDGDSTRDEFYPPRIQAIYSPHGWDYCGGDNFTANAQLTVSLYQSEGGPLLHSALPVTDGEGSFQVDLESVDLAPGMKLVVFDSQSTLFKSLTLVDLWVDVLDPGHNTVSGTAPAGSDVWISMMDGTGDDLGQWEATADGSGRWSVSCAPFDLDWASWGEVGVRDEDGDDTRTEAISRRISCDLVGDTIGGTAFSRNSTVTASVFASSSSPTPLWSGAVSADADGLVSVARSTHGLDLTGGMRVRIDDVAVPSIIKQVTLSPLTYDELDAVTDVAQGRGQPGSSVTIAGMGPDGGGEWAYVTPGADGNWRVDLAALGMDIALDVTSDATVYDPELDATRAPFVPHIVTLQSSTHPSPETWYTSHDPAFSWTPSPGAMGYSWVLDQAPTTIPDQTVAGAGTSCSFTGRADGVWYFHVRAFGGPGMRDGGGYWGATSHLAVRIDSTPPAIATLASTTHAGAAAWSTNNDPAFEWTAGASAADVAGFSWSLDQSAATTPDETLDGTETRTSFTDVADGVWYLHVRARDAAGNWGAAQHASVRIDTARPTPQAYAAGVRRGKRVSIGYRLKDPVGGSCQGTVKIVIRNVRGKVMKTKTINALPANVKKLWKFTCRFPAGRYTIRITGSDLAGNKGKKAATAVLRVR